MPPLEVKTVKKEVMKAETLILHRCSWGFMPAFGGHEESNNLK